MIGKVRKFIRNSSPDWLNVEVNQDFFTNFSTALTPDHESEELEVRSEELKTNSELRPAPSSAAKPPPNSELSSEVNPKSFIQNPKSADFPFQGKPHWRRIKQVFEVLELAGTGTYTELVNYVREVTGIGCSRKLISKWKRERHLCFASSPNDQRFEVPAFSFVEQQESELSQLSALGVSSIISSDCQSIEPSPSPPVSPSPRLPLSPSPPPLALKSRTLYFTQVKTAIILGVYPNSDNWTRGENFSKKVPKYQGKIFY